MDADVPPLLLSIHLQCSTLPFYLTYSHISLSFFVVVGGRGGLQFITHFFFLPFYYHSNLNANFNRPFFFHQEDASGAVCERELRGFFFPPPYCSTSPLPNLKPALLIKWTYCKEEMGGGGAIQTLLIEPNERVCS